MRRRSVLGAICGAGTLAATRRSTAQTLRPIGIGVLGDRSGIGATASGSATLAAARMAALDIGTLPDGRTVEILDAEFQLRPDDAVRIARRWFDEAGVDAIVDVPSAAAAAAIQDLARAKNRTFLATSSYNAALTGRGCSPTGSHWADDTYALTTSLVRTGAAKGARTWFMIGPDGTIGQSIQYDAGKAVEAAGGRVVGLARYPVGAMDFSSALEQAKASGAQAIGLCEIGDALSELLRQGGARNLIADGRFVAAFLTSIVDIRAAGLDAAQGLHVANGFYWDMNDQARFFARRFLAETARMPGKPQAATYAAIRHYVRAAIAADTTEATAVNVEMRRAPVYFFGRGGRIRLDGRVTLDMTVYRVKSPDRSTGEWDCCEIARAVPAAEAYRAATQSGCVLTP